MPAAAKDVKPSGLGRLRKGVLGLGRNLSGAPGEEDGDGRRDADAAPAPVDGAGEERPDEAEEGPREEEEEEADRRRDEAGKKKPRRQQRGWRPFRRRKGNKRQGGGEREVPQMVGDGFSQRESMVSRLGASDHSYDDLWEEEDDEGRWDDSSTSHVETGEEGEEEEENEDEDEDEDDEEKREAKHREGAHPLSNSRPQLSNSMPPVSYWNNSDDDNDDEDNDNDGRRRQACLHTSRPRDGEEDRARLRAAHDARSRDGEVHYEGGQYAMAAACFKEARMALLSLASASTGRGEEGDDAATRQRHRLRLVSAQRRQEETRRLSLAYWI